MMTTAPLIACLDWQVPSGTSMARHLEERLPRRRPFIYTTPAIFIFIYVPRSLILFPLSNARQVIARIDLWLALLPHPR